MSSFRRLLMIALLALGTPAALQACQCAISSRVGAPIVERPRFDRPRIFIGHVLTVDYPADRSFRMSVRFVTESSWRGPLPDTVTLRVEHRASCAWYMAGGRYLVLADTLAAGESTLTTAPCDDSWILGNPGASNFLAELGPPTWTAPPMGSRPLDAHAIHIGDSITAPDSVVFAFPRGGTSGLSKSPTGRSRDA